MDMKRAVNFLLHKTEKQKNKTRNRKRSIFHLIVYRAYDRKLNRMFEEFLESKSL